MTRKVVALTKEEVVNMKTLVTVKEEDKALNQNRHIMMAVVRQVVVDQKCR